jgi:3-phosphoglycerate kinase
LSNEHKLDYAIKYLKQEHSRIVTERDVANSNKDYDLANDMSWISNGLDAAIKLLEEKRDES